MAMKFPAKTSIMNGMTNGAITMVRTFITVAMGTSPLRSPVQTSAMPAQGTAPISTNPTAKSG